MISKKLTTTTPVASKLSIEKAKESKKSKVKESAKINLLIKMLEKETGKHVSILSEGLVSWVKSIYQELRNLYDSLKAERRILQKLV